MEIGLTLYSQACLEEKSMGCQPPAYHSSYFLLSSYFIPSLITVILKSLSSSMPQVSLTVFSTVNIIDVNSWEKPQ